MQDNTTDRINDIRTPTGLSLQVWNTLKEKALECYRNEKLGEYILPVNFSEYLPAQDGLASIKYIFHATKSLKGENSPTGNGKRSYKTTINIGSNFLTIQTTN